MTSTAVLQARTTYLLQVIERSLGEFAVERSQFSGVSPEVEDTSAASLSVGDRVSESYLSDVFGLALESSRGTSAHSEVMHLKVLAESLGIYEIRNACAHPNRPFFAHYWYRIATLAQDPAFRVIGLSRVSEALANAEHDSFTASSESWTVSLRTVIPNNLPPAFEHDRTGLLGRDSLEQQVARLLTIGRFPTVALVAPGGVGKTALALEVLKRIAYAVSPNNLEAVLFISLKTKELTVDGVRTLGEAPSIDDVESAISKVVAAAVDESDDVELEQLFASHGAGRLLICIDNLESLLLKNSAQFDDLLERIPANWRVLITSRIPVNSAHCLSLNVLQPITAGNLASGYSRAVGLKLSRQDADAIARTCNFNPLAIKLTVDAISAGKGIEDALAKSTADVLQFSYDTLLDVLSRQSVAILEVLFATGAITKSDIALVLDAEFDDVAAGLGSLVRTSLVHSFLEAGVEKFALNDAVRELLRSNPRNLELRGEISSKVANRRQQADGLKLEAERRGDSDYSEFHVPGHHPIALREIAHLIRRDKENDIRLAINKLSIIEADCVAVDTFWLLKGLALSKFRDPQAEVAFRQAVELGGSIRSKAALANWLQMSKRFPEAADLYGEIRNAGGLDHKVVGSFFADRYIRGLLMSSLFATRYPEVMELTRELLLAGYTSDVLCAARISAARMLFHHSRDVGMLQEAVDVFRVAVDRYGYTTNLGKEGIKILNDGWYNCNAGRLEQSAIALTARFAVAHYASIILAAPQKILTDEEWSTSKLLALHDHLGDEEELKSQLRRLVGVSHDGMGARSILSVPAKICEFNYPATHAYRFAVDREGCRHYLRMEDFDGGGPEWSCLLPRSQVYIIPGSIPESAGDCPRAIRISRRPIFSDD